MRGVSREPKVEALVQEIGFVSVIEGLQYMAQHHLDASKTRWLDLAVSLEDLAAQYKEDE